MGQLLAHHRVRHDYRLNGGAGRLGGHGKVRRGIDGCRSGHGGYLLLLNHIHP